MGFQMSQTNWLEILTFCPGPVSPVGKAGMQKRGES